ncbi:MAG: beta-ketoacyl-[acyl-carrier-protein] synthase family protein [Syntrophorhabdales bacterium]|jgi:3-oxoacyl-[acyl-carrier-protein] synthase II
MNREVVVTGIGVITCSAEGIEDFCQSLMEGRAAIGPVTLFDTSGYPCRLAGEIKSIRKLAALRREEMSDLGRASVFAIVAAQLALEDARFDPLPYSPSRIGVVLGTILADVQFIEEMEILGTRFSDHPMHQVPHYHPAINVARYHNCRGINYTLSAACASGNYAIGFGADIIKAGAADCVLCGGTDALSHLLFTGFNRLRVMAPEKCSAFDKNRKGMVLGEGSCIMVLEEKQAAFRRGAPIYCAVAGYGLTCDAYDLSAPKPDGARAADAMKIALSDARLKVTDINYINAHGTGTHANDKMECLAYRKVFGDLMRVIPTSSIKPMIGHTMGAAGAIEAAACAVALKYGIIPPTINFETEDPECDINLVPNSCLIRPGLKAALNNSFGFGGSNASVVFTSAEREASS